MFANITNSEIKALVADMKAPLATTDFDMLAKKSDSELQVITADFTTVSGVIKAMIADLSASKSLMSRNKHRKLMNTLKAEQAGIVNHVQRVQHQLEVQTGAQCTQRVGDAPATDPNQEQQLDAPIQLLRKKYQLDSQILDLGKNPRLSSPRRRCVSPKRRSLPPKNTHEKCNELGRLVKDGEVPSYTRARMSYQRAKVSHPVFNHGVAKPTPSSFGSILDVWHRDLASLDGGLGGSDGLYYSRSDLQSTNEYPLSDLSLSNDNSIDIEMSDADHHDNTTSTDPSNIEPEDLHSLDEQPDGSPTMSISEQSPVATTFTPDMNTRHIAKIAQSDGGRDIATGIYITVPLKFPEISRDELTASDPEFTTDDETPSATGTESLIQDHSSDTSTKAPAAGTAMKKHADSIDGQASEHDKLSSVDTPAAGLILEGQSQVQDWPVDDKTVGRFMNSNLVSSIRAPFNAAMLPEFISSVEPGDEQHASQPVFVTNEQGICNEPTISAAESTEDDKQLEVTPSVDTDLQPTLFLEAAKSFSSIHDNWQASQRAMSSHTKEASQHRVLELPETTGDGPHLDNMEDTNDNMESASNSIHTPSECSMNDTYEPTDDTHNTYAEAKAPPKTSQSIATPAGNPSRWSSKYLQAAHTLLGTTSLETFIRVLNIDPTTRKCTKPDVRAAFTALAAREHLPAGITSQTVKLGGVPVGSFLSAIPFAGKDEVVGVRHVAFAFRWFASERDNGCVEGNLRLLFEDEEGGE